MQITMNQVRYTDLGLKNFKEAWDFQQDIQHQLIRAKTDGINHGVLPCLIFVEHPHVYTLGKSGKQNNLLINPRFMASIGATFYKTDRGGDITYHGPGQLVGYPVFDLDIMGMGVRKYIFHIEESIIQTLVEFGIHTTRLEGATGVWITPDRPAPSRKICAIGVKVTRGITMHGFALNVSADLHYFNHINPCGFTDKKVTSIEKELGHKSDMSQVKQILLRKLSEQFNIEYT
jgi:lipoyl(octanoyl) transferase